MADRSDYIRDPIEAGIRKVREYQGITRTDVGSTKLTDIDGIGPSTAERLQEAGIDHPDELTGLTPNQLEAVKGIGPKKAETLAARFQYGQTRFGKHKNDDVTEDVRADMAKRSPDAKRTDRSFNAPITLDEDEWQANPDRLDFPGVDTIPEERRAQRVQKKAQRVRDKGGLKGINPEKLGGSTQGRYAGGMVSVDTSASFDPVSTVAHEVGHAADVGLGSGGRSGAISETFFDDDETVLEEAKKLTERRRPLLSDADKLTKYYDEQDFKSELFADAFAVAVEEPRAAKREAPNLFRKLKDTTIRDIGRF